MPQYGQGGKMSEYAEGGEMEGGAEKLQMLKAAYDKAKDENNEEMVEKIEGVVSDMLASAKSKEAKEMIMEMFPGMGAPSMDKGGSFPDLNEDGDVTYADVLKGRGVDLDEDKMEMPGGGMMEMKKMMMAYGGTMGKKKKKMTYPGGGYVMMK